MALFISVFQQLFECFAHFLRRRETPQRAQQRAAQGLTSVEKPPECEDFDCTANDRKYRKRCRKVPEKYPLGERKEEREVKMEKLMEGGSELQEAGEKKRKKWKITESMPLLVTVQPLHTTVRSCFLKPTEEELPMLPSVSGHLALPAAGFKPLPPVTQPPVHPQKVTLGLAPVDVSLPCCLLQVDPPKLLAVPSCSDEVVSLQCSSSQMLPLAVPPIPTPAPDEVIALQRPPSQKPKLFTSSPFEPHPQLMLVDIEDEENEYVEYTGKTIRASDLLKSERPQMPEAEMKPRKMVALLEKDCEVQEEAWVSEMEEVQRFEEEEGDPSEMGYSKATQGHLGDASQIDEPMMKLFCVASSDGPKNETQHNVNVQKKCKRKMTLALFTWAAEKAKKKKKKRIKAKRKRVAA